MSEENNKWLSYEEYLNQQEQMAEAERKIFIKNGLGWLVKFLDDAKESREERPNEAPKSES